MSSCWVFLPRIKLGRSRELFLNGNRVFPTGHLVRLWGGSGGLGSSAEPYFGVPVHVPASGTQST